MTAAGAVSAAQLPEKIWTIGTNDGTGDGFALAPDRFRDFIAADFGYEDKYYLIGHSSPEKDFPYTLPGPADTWGGTWSTAGWRIHQVNILFGLEEAPEDKDYTLTIDLADYSKRFLPLVKISVNTQDTKLQLQAEGYDLSKQKKPNQTEPLLDTLSLTGDYSGATPYRIDIPVKAGVLKKGGNKISITILEGSWIIFDHISLSGLAVRVPAVIRDHRLFQPHSRMDTRWTRVER